MQKTDIKKIERKVCVRKLAIVLLAIVCFVGSAYAAALAKSDVVYTRSNLQAEKSKIFWHNMRSFSTSIPVGTEMRIKKSDAGLITFVTTDTNKMFYLYADSGQWDKYFVKDRKEIGLEKISPNNKDFVAKGGILCGMSKEEVYISKGCPAYIAWGKKSERNSFDEIMQSDKWYYMDDTFSRDRMVKFANGIVVDYGIFEK